MNSNNEDLEEQLNYAISKINRRQLYDIEDKHLKEKVNKKRGRRGTIGEI